MKIAFIQKTTGRGGSKNSLAESLRVLAGEPAFETVVVVGESGSFVERCESMAVRTIPAELPEWRKALERLRFHGAMKRLAGSLRDFRPDWIIANEMWWGPHAERVARHLGCRSAVILRDGIATVKKSLQYRLDRNHLILPVSSTIADALMSHTALADRVQVLFNSVSVPPDRPEDAAALDRLLQPFPEVGRWLLVVGKLGARKNQADAVRVTRTLIDGGHADLGLLLAGDIDPAYRPQMESVIAETGLAGRVAMIGNFDGLAALLDRAATVLLPSFREGLPRSLVEAIIAGKPAFSYPCEGVEDIFDAHRGRFVSAESAPDSLSGTLLRAWADVPGTAAAFAAVRRRVLENFSPQAHLARLAELLGATTRHTS